MKATRLVPNLFKNHKAPVRKPRTLRMEGLERRELFDGAGLIATNPLGDVQEALLGLEAYASEATESQNSIQPRTGLETPKVADDAKDLEDVLDTISPDLVSAEGRQIWHNRFDAADVNFDSVVSPVDALAIINRLNDRGSEEVRGTNRDADYFMDTNDDGSVSAVDVLLVVNRLNQSASTDPTTPRPTPALIDPVLDSNPIPEVGQLQVYDHPICTATLITTQHVLTAAHCVDSANGKSDRASDYATSAYSFKFNAPGQGLVTVSAQRIDIHEKYQYLRHYENGDFYDEVKSDIALIFLKRPVTEINRPWPTEFNGTYLYDGEVKPGDNAVIIGYGGGDNQGKTGVIEIDKVTNDEIHWYTDIKGEALIENGDSGGPMFRVDGNRYQLMGVHSASDQKVGFGKDMRVAAFKPWIQTIIGNEAGVSGPRATYLGKTQGTERANYVEFGVEYADNSGVEMTSVDASDVQVVSSDGTETAQVQLIARQESANGKVTAIYAFRPSGRHASYVVSLNNGAVRDQQGAPAHGQQLAHITLKTNFDLSRAVDLKGGRDSQTTVQDNELDTDDWTRVDVGYKFQFNRDEQGRATGVSLKLWMEAWELEKNKSYKGKTRIKTERVIPLFQLDATDPRRIRNIVTNQLTSDRTGYYRGEQHGNIGIGHVGSLSDVSVRIDGRGRSDHLLQRLVANINASIELTR